MNWCKPHWDELRRAIQERGLDKFGAQTGEQAAKQIVCELEGQTTQFDPLMGSWSRINLFMAQSLQKQGRDNEILLLRCPLCILIEDGQPHLIANWVNGVTDEALKYALDQGLVKDH